MKNTVVAHGSLLYEEMRVKNARENRIGMQTLALEHFFERLAGGFLKIVDVITLREIISQAAELIEWGELDPIKALPGVPKAAANSLMKCWMANINYDDFRHSPRMAALQKLDAFVTEKMPRHLRKPNEIARLAEKKIHLTKKIFGNITLSGFTDIHPLWRSIISRIAEEGHGEVIWDSGAKEVPNWVKQIGSVAIVRQASSHAQMVAETFPDKRYECMEALRWATELVASGVKESDIAIASISVGGYDEIFRTLDGNHPVRILTLNGVPVLNTPYGQQCAALSDVLLRGLSHKKIKRLFQACASKDWISEFGLDWLDLLPPHAALMSLGRWHDALSYKNARAYKDYVFPVIELLSQGIQVCEAAGEKMLCPEALKIWRRALKSGPIAAIDDTLRRMKVQADLSACDHVVFVSTTELSSSPRKYVRVIGATAQSWPRADGSDALIPDFIVDKNLLHPLSNMSGDRIEFDAIKMQTEKELIISWPRANSEGRENHPSSLLDNETIKKARHMSRTDHRSMPFSVTDQIFMDAAEFKKSSEAIRITNAIKNWQKSEITENDGVINSSHPVILKLLQQRQSATSLQKLIRDPLGFVWKYALGFHAPEYEDEPVVADARTFGNIVHAIIRVAADKIKSKGRKPSNSEIMRAVQHARFSVELKHEANNPVPPKLIWLRTMDMAEKVALNAINFEYPIDGHCEIFSEVPFGKEKDWLPEELPWSLDRDVVIPNTDIRIHGIIDRLMWNSDKKAAHIIDFKTGKPSEEDGGIAGGKEMQRVIYHSTVKTLLDNPEIIEAALFFTENNRYMPLEDYENAANELAAAINIASSILKAGKIAPGIDADGYNDLLFCFPARATNIYLPKKYGSLPSEYDDLKTLWGN